MTERSWIDTSGNERLRGTIDPEPGGFTPVTCLLQTASIDIAGAGNHPLLWTFLSDNAWDGNPLVAIPAGLGLTFAFNGSAATITTTTAGTWGFSLAAQTVNDATWEGLLILDLSSAMQVSGSTAGLNPRLTVSQVVTYPSGANLVPALVTDVVSTAPALNAIAYLTIVRLG